MNPKEAIENIVATLDAGLSAPVRTSGLEGERPVPVVIVDDWTMQDLNLHNSGFAGTTDNVDVDGDGAVEYTRWYRFYYEMRVELVARDSDDVGAHTLISNVQSVLRDCEVAPQTLHDHVNEVDLGTSGQLSYQFNEPKETEINQSFSLTAFFETHVSADTSEHDVLQQVTKTYTIN